MSFMLSKKLPTPAEIKEQYPVSEDVAALKAHLDQELIDIITGISDNISAYTLFNIFRTRIFIE